jgi:hypothetical protein
VALLLAIAFVMGLPISIVAFDLGRSLFSPEGMGRLLRLSFDEAGGFRRLAIDVIFGGDGSGSGEEQGFDLRTATSFLTRQERDYLAERLLPSEWVDSQLDAVLTDLYAWIDNDRARPDLKIDLRAIKGTLRAGGADELIEVIVDSWPACSVDQVAAIAGQILGLAEGFPFCEPPEPLRTGLVGMAGEAIKLGLYGLPDRLALSSAPASGVASADVLQFKGNVRLVRAVSLWGWLVPPVLLVLILALAIRSWRDLTLGWGVPLIAGGLLTILAAFGVRIAAGEVIPGMATGPGLPPILGNLFRTVVQTWVTTSLRSVGFHGGMTLVAGALVFGIGRLLERRAKQSGPPASPAPDQAKTLILPKESPPAEGERPTGMFG